MAKMDVHNLKMELKRKNDKIREIENNLDTEKNMVSKLQLERDLADAESTLVRKQIKDILKCYSVPTKNVKKITEDEEDPLQYVVAHQFVPFPNQQQYYPNSDLNKEEPHGDVFMMDQHSNLGERLLDGWQNQEKLVYLMSKYLAEQCPVSIATDEQEVLQERKQSYWTGFLFPLLLCPIRRRKFGFQIVKKKAMTKKQKSKLLRGLRLLNQPKYHGCQYQAIIAEDYEISTTQKYDQDDDDERTAYSNDDNTTTATNDVLATRTRRIQNCTSTNSMSPAASCCLIQELVSSHETNRKCMEDARALINMQATRIQKLEHELCHFIYFPTSCRRCDGGICRSSCSSSGSSSYSVTTSTRSQSQEPRI